MVLFFLSNIGRNYNYKIEREREKRKILKLVFITKIVEKINQL